MEILRDFSDIFWSAKVWLPSNTTWADIASISHSESRDLIWCIPLALLFILSRYLIETKCLPPLGKSLGIKSRKSQPAAPNPILEAAYIKNYRLKQKTTVGLAKELDLTERQIERWWRLRRAQDKPSTLDRFCESAYRLLYYTCSSIYGLIVLWDKPWFWNAQSVWYGHPYNPIDRGLWWHSMISLSLYCAFTITQLLDNKRKDFWQIFVHHVTAALIMVLCWGCNLLRVASLVLVVHDITDIFLEPTKIAQYAKYRKTGDCLLPVFTVVWIVTRLVCFPRLIYSCVFEAPRFVSMFPALHLITCAFLVLLVLHVLWTCEILRVLHTAIRMRQTDDVRSSSSEISDNAEGSQSLANNSHRNKANN
ncbi:Ceramide synthase 2 [Pseudolycoriella hygida]|uniref:Ceramide synthase 2 n=1 Tax=Pseudolycoriella hygida TaxID=35572 RepID=A0A9Q0MP48_9DIPT|nr:Ceramide synthase 2 [Pseudolycoriella hygida]